MPKVEGVVQRSLEFMFKEDRQSFLSEFDKGDHYKSKQYLSSSLGKVYNDDGNIQLIILSKTGRDIRSLNSDESEILFKRNIDFNILDVEEKGKCTFNYLKEVDEND